MAGTISSALIILALTARGRSAYGDNAICDRGVADKMVIRRSAFGEVCTTMAALAAISLAGVPRGHQKSGKGEAFVEDAGCQGLMRDPSRNRMSAVVLVTDSTNF